MARGLKFQIKEVERFIIIIISVLEPFSSTEGWAQLYYLCSENKSAGQLLIFAFVFAYTKDRFSYDAAQLMVSYALAQIIPVILILSTGQRDQLISCSRKLLAFDR